MIPLRDSIPSHHTPFVNYFLIALTCLAFYAQVTSGDGGQRLIEQYGMVPARVTDPGSPVEMRVVERVSTPLGPALQERTRELAPAAVPPLMTLVTCIFLHGGWMHFIGNMWFLFIFGDNVEDRFGHFGYLLMYLGTGVLASLAHLVTNAESPIPTIGASGAIAGVMGAYFVLYPHARVIAVLPLLIIFYTFVVPAPVFLGIWLVFQVLNAMAMEGGAAGVAWWAHVGGFVAGAGLGLVLAVTGIGRLEATDEPRPHRF